MPEIKVNGVNINYELRGRGEPLVLIGGLSIDIVELEPVISELAGRFQVLAFDNRGSGLSGKPDEPYSIGMMAEDTAALMEAAGIGRASVIGISMGGRIALTLALSHPDKISRLVLVSTSCRGIRGWRYPVLDFISRLPGLRGRNPQPAYARRRQHQAVLDFDCCASLGDIQAPTLILHGRKDRIAPYPLAQEMHAAINGSQLVTFAGGHLFLFLSPKGWQKFFDTVDEFLSQRPS